MKIENLSAEYAVRKLSEAGVDIVFDNDFSAYLPMERIL